MSDEQLRSFLYDLLVALGQERVEIATVWVQCELAKLNGRRDAAMLLGRIDRYEDDGNMLFAPANGQMTKVRK